ncbi:hypothetical protein AB4452_04675 [Vibrio lentus]
MANPNWYKGMPAPKGAGRPKGSRNKLTQKELDFVASQEGTLTQKLMKMSECGDPDLEFKAVSKLLDFINSRDLNTHTDDDKAEMNHADIEARIAELEAK